MRETLVTFECVARRSGCGTRPAERAMHCKQVPEDNHDDNHQPDTTHSTRRFNGRNFLQDARIASSDRAARLARGQPPSASKHTADQPNKTEG